MPKKKSPRWFEFSSLPSPPEEFGTPDCFTDLEWAAYFEAEKQAVWNQKSLAKSIQKDMCEDCTLAYQYHQVRAGKCNPHYGAPTPAHRMALLIAGEDDHANRPRKSRAVPWAESEDES